MMGIRNLSVAAAVVLSVVGFGHAAEKAAEKAPQSVIDYANRELVKWGSDPVIVKAIREDNAKGATLDDIKKADDKWQKTPGMDEFMKGMMESECGKHLQELAKSQPHFSEIFVMNRLGANVAMTDKTSDYWQGDEPKFIKSFNEGKGGLHFSDVEFDDSSQSYLVQVSVPVKEVNPQTQEETVLGAITVGINMDEFK